MDNNTTHHHNHSFRKRSRSPERARDREIKSSEHKDVKRHRSRSPHRRHRHHHHHDRHSNNNNNHHHHSRTTTATATAKPVSLPYGARHLHRSDQADYEALFAEYLDLQKQLDISRLSAEEVRGRWKSFRSKWNDGLLAEGWYDPATKERADERAAESTTFHGAESRRRGSGERDGEERSGRNGYSRTEERGLRRDGDDLDEKEVRQGSTIRQANTSLDEDNVNIGHGNDENSDIDEEDDDDIGPAPLTTSTNQAHGPTIPGFDDLQHRNELLETDTSNSRADLRWERKQDRQEQKARLEEIAPRADPGSRERQLEKRREVAAVNREFRDAREGGEQEIGDGELMGGGGGAGDEGGIEGLKARRREQERKKNEREIRKEEVLRARAAEREEKLKLHRAKEEKTMDMLKAIARQRFGAGDDGNS